MNRKIAVAAIVGGLMHTMSVLRGQEVQPVPRERPRLPSGRVPPAQTNATLTPAVINDLQRQITELAGRVSVLEQKQANSLGFTKVGNDFVFAPDSGNVKINAPQGLTIQGATTMELTAGASMRLRADGDIEQRGAMIRLN
jgi:hypothetical protein